MEGPTLDDSEIQRMRQLLTQGFDDNGADDGTIEYIVSEHCLLRRNSEYAKKNTKKPLWGKWIKVFRYRQ